MSEQRVTTETASIPGYPPMAYRTLTGLCMLLFACGLIARWPILFRYHSAWPGHMLNIEFYVALFFLFSCAAVVSGRWWAVHWVRAGSLWLLALRWSDIPSVLDPLIDRWMYGRPIDITGMARFTEPNAFLLKVLLLYAVEILTLLTLLVSSEVVCDSQTADRTIPPETAQPEPGKRARLLGAGLALIGLGLVCSWLDRSLLSGHYLDIVKSYLLTGALISLLLWHLLVRRVFWIGAPICASAITLTCAGYASWPQAIVVWLPWLAMAAANLWRKDVTARLRLTPLATVILFGAITSPQPFLPGIGHMAFWPYPRPVTERPVDFPDYIRPPQGAYDVTYFSGKCKNLSFAIDTSYPASRTIEFISDLLARAGWKELDYDLLGPTVKSSHSHGWFYPAPSQAGSDQPARDNDHPMSYWRAQWINDANDIVSVQLSGPPKDHANPVTLLATITLNPPESVRQLLDNYRKVRARQDHPQQPKDPNSPATR